MSLLIELVLYLIVEVLGDLLLEGATHGAARVLRSQTGRFVVSGLCGLGVGLAWGLYLRGADTWPRLLWVSLVVALVALLVAAGRQGAPNEATIRRSSGWRRSLLPPWLWPAERLLALAVLNGGIAVGIVLTFRHGPM